MATQTTRELERRVGELEAGAQLEGLPAGSIARLIADPQARDAIAALEERFAESGPIPDEAMGATIAALEARLDASKGATT